MPLVKQDFDQQFVCVDAQETVDAALEKLKARNGQEDWHIVVRLGDDVGVIQLRELYVYLAKLGSALINLPFAELLMYITPVHTIEWPAVGIGIEVAENLALDSTAGVLIVVQRKEVIGRLYKHVERGGTKPHAVEVKVATPFIETWRLDTATPTQAYLGREFSVAATLRQLLSPTLKVAELAATHSAPAQIFWEPETPFTRLRLRISAPECAIHGDDTYTFRLYQGQDAPVFFFQLTPKVTGELSLVLKVYQEEDCLGSAYARVAIQEQVTGQVNIVIESHDLGSGADQENRYADLKIHLGPFDSATQSYTVAAQLNDGSYYTRQGLCVDEEQLWISPYPQQHGVTLFDTIFCGPIRDAYLKAMTYAETHADGYLRMRLWIDQNAADLQSLTWEQLHHRVQGLPLPLAASRDIFFSRYVDLEKPEPPPIKEQPLRWLCVVSNPLDLADYQMSPIDVEEEITNLIEALRPGCLPPQIQGTIMPGQSDLSTRLRAKLKQAGFRIRNGPASLENLIDCLGYDPGYHIVHLVGHGRFTERKPGMALVLEDQEGWGDFVPDTVFAQQFSLLPSLPHLIFLSMCGSAQQSHKRGSPFVGLAPQLIRAGVPVVVAMQNDVSITTARALARGFYSHLLEHGIVDKAMNQTRMSLFSTRKNDWAIPVLFMRLRDGRLFDSRDIV